MGFDPACPEGWNNDQKQTIIKRKKTLEVLAKENAKVTDWSKEGQTGVVEAKDAITDVDMRDEELENEAAQPCLETIMRLMKRESRKAAWVGRMVAKALVTDLV